MCALTGSSTRTSGFSAGPSPFSSLTASPIIRTYRSNPTPAMCPDCSPPSRLPAPRISRSFMATYMPAPTSVCWATVASRSCAVSVSERSGG